MISLLEDYKVYSKQYKYINKNYPFKCNYI